MKIEPTTPRLDDITLLAMDLFVVSVFVSTGLIRHGVNPLQQPMHSSLVIAPFLLGWIIASSMTGLYQAERSQERWFIGATALTWLIAGSIGLALRSTVYLPGNAPPAFIAVMLGFGLAALILWRLFYLGLHRARDKK